MPDSHRNPLQTHITRPTPAIHHHDRSRSFYYSGRFPPTALRGGTPSTPLGKQNGPGFRSKTKCHYRPDIHDDLLFQSRCMRYRFEALCQPRLCHDRRDIAIGGDGFRDESLFCFRCPCKPGTHGNPAAKQDVSDAQLRKDRCMRPWQPE